MCNTCLNSVLATSCYLPQTVDKSLGTYPLDVFLEYTRFSVQTLLPSPVLLVFHLEMSDASSDNVKEIFGDLVCFQTPILSHIM